MFKTMLKTNYKLNEEMLKGLKENNEIYSDCYKLFESETHVIGLKDVPGDFGPEELADVVDIAERLYEAIGKPVCLCLAMDRLHKVTVKEMTIKSEADFSIKLACLDMYEIAIEKIRQRIASGIADDADRQVLETMPMTVPGYQRKQVRKECFELLNAF